MYSFVREKDVACVESYFHTLLRPYSYFGDTIQDAKQLFLSRLLQNDQILCHEGVWEYYYVDISLFDYSI
jgi:hypothetical protein